VVGRVVSNDILMLTDLLILSVIVIPTIMSDYKLYSFSDVIKKSGIVKRGRHAFIY
jgi:hypothetical protein